MTGRQVFRALRYSGGSAVADDVVLMEVSLTTSEGLLTLNEKTGADLLSDLTGGFSYGNREFPHQMAGGS